MTKPFRIDLDLDDVEYIQNALEAYMRMMSEMARQNNETPMQNVEGDVITIDLSDMFSAQYIDAKALRKRFVELVGRDLTEQGQ